MADRSVTRDNKDDNHCTPRALNPVRKGLAEIHRSRHNVRCLRHKATPDMPSHLGGLALLADAVDSAASYLKEASEHLCLAAKTIRGLPPPARPRTKSSRNTSRGSSSRVTLVKREPGPSPSPGGGPLLF